MASVCKANQKVLLIGGSGYLGVSVLNSIISESRGPKSSGNSLGKCNRALCVSTVLILNLKRLRYDFHTNAQI